MKKIMFLAFAFLLTFVNFGQMDTTTIQKNKIEANPKPSFMLLGGKKPKNIAPSGYVAFVKYSKSIEHNMDGHPLTESYEKLELNLQSFINEEEVRARVKSQEQKTYKEGLVMTSELNTYFEESEPTVGLKLPEYQGMYYSSPLRMKLRSTFFTLSVASAFTALVIAPIASFQYAKGANAYNQYDRNVYFGLLGLSAGVAAVSVPMYFVLKPKYYSFNGELLVKSKRRWKLIGTK